MLVNVQEGLQPWITGTGFIVWCFMALIVIKKLVAALRSRSSESISGRWVLVTGCDSGFGQGVVAELVSREANVIACCLTPDGAAAALVAGARAAPCLDLSDDAAVNQVAGQADALCEGSLWGLVHCAGVVLPGFADYQPIDFYRQTMAVNFYAPVLLTQKLLASLRQARGRVVLVSSVDGIVSLPGNAPYDASKFALEAYADALRAELSFWQVSVSVINPSTMRTPLAMSFFESHRKAWQEMARIDPGGAWRSAWPEHWLERYITVNTPQLEKIAQDPALAVGDIVHALTATRPKLRYLSGTMAKTLFYALWVGPESWSLKFKKLMIQPPPPVDPT